MLLACRVCLVENGAPFELLEFTDPNHPSRRQITTLRQSDITLRSGALGCQGKGRKERCTPLAKPTVSVLAAWVKEQGKDSSKILFPSARGGPLSSDSVQYLVTKYAAVARKKCLWLSKTPSELKTRKSRLHADNSLLEKLIEVSVQQRCNGVLNRKAGSAEKNPVSARDEIALVHKTNGSYRRRGPTNSKRRGVGIDDGVLRPEESLRCARVLASPRLSIPEHLWPAPDEFGSPGSRQNNFAESGATIFHSTR